MCALGMECAYWQHEHKIMATNVLTCQSLVNIKRNIKGVAVINSTILHRQRVFRLSCGSRERLRNEMRDFPSSSQASGVWHVYRWAQNSVSPLRQDTERRRAHPRRRTSRSSPVTTFGKYSRTRAGRRGVGADCPIASYFHDTITDKPHIVRPLWTKSQTIPIQFSNCPTYCFHTKVQSTF